MKTITLAIAATLALGTAAYAAEGSTATGSGETR